MKKSKFTESQIVFALLQAETGTRVGEVCRKMGVSEATYYNWKKKHDQMGQAGLQHSMTKEKLKRIGELEEEVDLLKKLLAEKEMESQLKDELLKKKYPKVKRKYS